MALCLQDIPRTADRAPSRCFYTWGVDLERSFTRLGGGLSADDEMQEQEKQSVVNCCQHLTTLLLLKMCKYISLPA